MNIPITESKQNVSSEGTTTLCPVTRLPLLRKSEWRHVRLSSASEISLGLVGDSIVLCRFEGYAVRETVQKGLNLWKQYMAEAVPEDRPYVFVLDFSAFKGATAEARLYFINSLKKNINSMMRGLIFFGASVFMRISIQLGIRMNSRYNIQLKKDYASAMQAAQSVIRNSERNRSGIPVGSDWKLPLNGFSIQYKLVEDDLIHVAVSGYMDESHIAPLKQMREKMASRLDFHKAPLFFLLDLTGATGSSFAARRAFMKDTRKFYSNRSKPVYIVYGAGPMLRTVINISSALLPIRIIQVKDHEAALSVVFFERSKASGSPLPLGRNSPIPAPSHTDQIQQYVDELLDYLGQINWEGSGFYEQTPAVQPPHPFKPVFDAISLIKTEIDLLFQERKEAEEELRESEEKFKSLSSNTPDIIYTLDTGGSFTYVNPAWENILGHKKKDVVGRRFNDFADESERGQIDHLFRILDRKEIVRDKLITLLHRDGTPRLFNINGAPNFNSSGQLVGIVGIMKDITEHRRLEAQFQQAQKMEAVGTLAGGIAHDFNNLLMGIQGYVSLLLLAKEQGDPEFDKLRSIEKQVQSGADLTRQLLGFARAGQYQVKPTDLNDLISKSAAMFGRTKKEIQIHQKLQPDIRSVEVDRGQIEQVLLNLYINAWQAMPAGGDLFLSTQNVVLEDDYARPLEAKPGNYVKIAVTDTGIGMDEKVRKRIFEPFFTTKEMGRGTGLGLASAYGIVKGHDGLINVYSERGHGTTFNIYLPASEKERSMESPLVEKTLKGTETILVIDDEKIVLTVSREILEVLGYTVLVANSGREAIELYALGKEKIDLVILDMIMPEMSGREIFSELKKMNPDIKVILSSGYSINGEATKIMKSGCKAFIQKPFSLKQLSNQVRNVIDNP